MNSTNSLNPFGYIFAERFLGEDHPCYIKYKKEKEVYKYNCLPHTLTKNLISPHYASVYFKIVKNKRRGLWTEEEISYETHYICLSYFMVWLGLSIEEFVDIDIHKHPFYTFKRDCPHPLNKPIIFIEKEKLSFYIETEVIHFPTIKFVNLLPRDSLEKYKMVDEDADEERKEALEVMVEEYDPMQWY
jgi:hypothetical protein